MHRLAIGLLMCVLAGHGADAVERCDKPSKAGIKRCENVVKAQDSTSPAFTTITYSNRNRDIVDWEISFPRKGGDATAAILMVGSSIAILSPEMPRDNRLEFVKRLLANAAEPSPKFIPAGRYDWISARTDANFMIRASRRK